MLIDNPRAITSSDLLGYVYTAPVQFGAESKVLLIGLPSTLVLRNRYDSDPANRYSFDPARKADYS